MATGTGVQLAKHARWHPGNPTALEMLEHFASYQTNMLRKMGHNNSLIPQEIEDLRSGSNVKLLSVDPAYWPFAGYMVRAVRNSLQDELIIIRGRVSNRKKDGSAGRNKNQLTISIEGSMEMGQGQDPERSDPMGPAIQAVLSESPDYELNLRTMAIRARLLGEELRLFDWIIGNTRRGLIYKRIDTLATELNRSTHDTYMSMEKIATACQAEGLGLGKFVSYRPTRYREKLKSGPKGRGRPRNS